MVRSQHVLVQRLLTLCVTALLVVPIVLSGHRHETGQPSSAHACALCQATHSSPAVTAPPVPLVAPSLDALPFTPSRSARVPRVSDPAHTGRAPPVGLATQLV
jgi:hypothetical protein